MPTTTYYYTNDRDTTYQQWGRIGTTPYLSAIDYPVNYIIAPDGRVKKEGIWDFPNSGSENAETLNNVYVEVYCLGGEDPDLGMPSLKIYVYDGSTWQSYSLTTPASWSWLIFNVSAFINTWAKLDACQVYLDNVLIVSGSIDVDCLRLRAVSTPAAVTRKSMGFIF